MGSPLPTPRSAPRGPSGARPPATARVTLGRLARLGAVAALAAALLPSPAPAGVAAPRRSAMVPAAGDPLAADAARWSELLHARAATGGAWPAVEQAARPGLAGVTAALADGRRLLALWRLANAQVEIAGAVYRAERPAAQGRDIEALAAEWKRQGTVLHADLGPPAAAALGGVHPALARAIGEAALPQVREWYQASLDYGRNTTPQEGLLYLGNAVAQQQLVAFSRTLGDAFPRFAPPPLRPLDTEIGELEAAVQAAFHPPASIERHSDFVGTSELLKEARELNAAGLRYGALLRYLQAALASRPLRPAPPAADLAPEILARRLADLDRRLAPGSGPAVRAAAGGPADQAAPTDRAGHADDTDRTDHSDHVDQSIGRLFLEIAQAHFAARNSPGNAEIAAALAGDVLPRYLAALAPARGAPPVSPPRALPAAGAVTVTLVRWPYT